MKKHRSRRWLPVAAPLGVVALGVLGGDSAAAQVRVPPPAPGARSTKPRLLAPTAEEKKLHRLVNQYRQQHGLGRIPLCRSLTHVAKVHAMDLQRSPRKPGCNMHSWSQSRRWKGCCYTSDHARARCMWSKPRELTKYRGNGFENAFAAWRKATAAGALASWKGSPGHNGVILNQGMWKKWRWRCLGVGLYGRYGVLWFGKAKDPAGNWVE
jgi:hypothetical protein